MCIRDRCYTAPRNTGGETMTQSIHETLETRLGEKGWLTGDITQYTQDWMGELRGDALGVALPANKDDVSFILRAAREHNVSVTPQGGNTGLVGGSIPQSDGAGNRRAIVLNLSRMNAIHEVSARQFSARVDAGVILSDLHGAVEAEGMQFPLSLGAKGSAQIGGLISTNAGGTHAFRYGMMQDLVLGLEVVLPDGSFWDGNRSLIKDNCGYSLRRLFGGAEGTLGVITGATLKLFPGLRAVEAAFLGVSDGDKLVRLGSFLRRELGDFLTAMEFIGEFGYEMAQRNLPNAARPFAGTYPWQLLVEVGASSGRMDLRALLEATLEGALSEGLIEDGVVAQSGPQRESFWYLREEQAEAQRLEGRSLHNDVAIPVGAFSEFVGEATRVCGEILPGVRVNAFGHLGDGNVHFGLCPPAGDGDGEMLFGKSGELAEGIYGVAVGLGGTFSAEHGLGRSKAGLADKLRGGGERGLMRTLKGAIDPDGLMNPGVIVAG
ncbi:MAG: FAD-binding oxidoreductase [Alphaproteobacteria bacterium]|nr:FAD-binding oxidoreductase [Alphaproteobacteria bacterium]